MQVKVKLGNHEIAIIVSKQIVDKLFVNGAGQQAERLMLVLENGKDGGGWGKQPMRDIILNHIFEALEQVK